MVLCAALYSLVYSLIISEIISCSLTVLFSANVEINIKISLLKAWAWMKRLDAAVLKCFNKLRTKKNFSTGF